MTKQEYKDYEKRFERGTKGLEFLSSGPCPGCTECGLPNNPEDADYEACNEGAFSWSPCDICGTPLGGTRYPAHGILKSDPPLLKPDNIVHLNVCSDCVYYLEYGQLDDSTMMEIEDDEIGKGEA